MTTESDVKPQVSATFLYPESDLADANQLAQVAEFDDANTAALNALQRDCAALGIGLDPASLVLQVTVTAMIEYLFGEKGKSARALFDLAHGERMTRALDDLHAQVTRARLTSPPVASSFVVPGRG